MSDIEKNVKIGNVPYAITPHPADELGDLALKLGGLAVGPVITLIKEFQGMGDNVSDILDADLSELDAEAIQRTIYFVTERLDQDEIKHLFKYTMRNGQDLGEGINYAQAFRGNWVEWYKAIFQILKINGFLDFLPSASGGGAEDLMKK